MKANEIIAVFCHSPQLTVDFHAECWRSARRLAIDRNWRGEEAPVELKTTAMVVYREFEVAPTGQWCDLIVDRTKMLADWRWQSGMRTASEVIESEKIWRAAMAVPYDAFGCVPRANDLWHANLFRVSRSGGERQYLALSPTFDEKPNFHVAEAFVKLRFVA
jgi:hypothetical protein